MRCTWQRGDVLVIDDVPVADLSRSWVLERARATIDGIEWHFGADGSDRVARRGPGAEADVRARRTSFFGRTWVVTSPTAVYTVRPGGLFSRRLAVEAEGEAVGQLTPRTFSDRPDLTTSVDLPHLDAIFLLWLGFVLTRRESSAGGGATAAVSS